jgi:hypothetical protein
MMQNQNIQPNGISSLAVSPQANQNIANNNNPYFALEQEIGAMALRISELTQRGVLTQSQGQYLMTQLAGKAKVLDAQKSSNSQFAQVQAEPQQPSQAQNPLDMFNQERPGFFNEEGRGDVLDYIKGFDMDKDELLKISQLMEGLESSAVEKYLKNAAHEKSLNDENSLAKSKLTSYAQNASSNSNMDRVFTREAIGKMSGKEFTQNEKLIMDQLKQGMIK